MVKTALSFVIVLVAITGSAQQLDSSYFSVSANRLYQATTIQVKKGETYEITAEGQWQDASFPATDANGFKGFTAPMFFGMLLKPMPSQWYMKLCGKVGNWKFPIGTKTTITIKRNGELELFPNDAKGFFDNNNGKLRVTIKPL